MPNYWFFALREFFHNSGKSNLKFKQLINLLLLEILLVFLFLFLFFSLFLHFLISNNFFCIRCLVGGTILVTEAEYRTWHNRRCRVFSRYLGLLESHFSRCAHWLNVLQKVYLFELLRFFHNSFGRLSCKLSKYTSMIVNLRYLFTQRFFQGKALNLKSESFRSLRVVYKGIHFLEHLC